jgi:hypothetical protein
MPDLSRPLVRMLARPSSRRKPDASQTACARVYAGGPTVNYVPHDKSHRVPDASRGTRLAFGAPGIARLITATDAALRAARLRPRAASSATAAEPGPS